MYAETREQADEQIDAFAKEFSPKYDKAVDCLLSDRKPLLARYDLQLSTGSTCAPRT